MFSCEYWGILKKTYFEEHLRGTAYVGYFKILILRLNIVCIICIILIIRLTAKIKIKIYLLGQLWAPLQKYTK